jgi:ferredoxin-NADP reductase/MOSC domain-containing protein YiiM
VIGTTLHEILCEAPDRKSGERVPDVAPGQGMPRLRAPAPEADTRIVIGRSFRMAVVVSVNVGLPREVVWQGRTVRTAIWKQPVPGRVFAGRLNLTGDAQGDLAGHGGEQRALMVYQLDSYRYWEIYLQRSDFVYGQFGENLTVDGLADAEVCIGDRFRIGSGVFEVTQPRVTCYRLGLRLNHHEMPALVVSHRRPGFYLRVIEEGEIGAGDQIEKIADGPEQMTVVEIDALLYTPDHPVEALRRAVRIPALSPGWQDSMKALLDAAEEGRHTGNAGLSSAQAAPLSWRGFRPLKVIASTAESEDVRSFDIADIDGSHLPAAVPGQHIVVRLRPGADSPPVTRIYSLCGPQNAGSYRIAVKREGGIGSTFLSEHVQVGDMLEASAPRGAFSLAPGATPVALLSAGIGVTPLLAMLYSIATNDEILPRDVWWIHAARDKAHHSFAGPARSLVTALKRGHLCIIYSRPGVDDEPGVDYDLKGHLTLPLLQQIGVPQNADFYLCGPPRFLSDLETTLNTWAGGASRIHTEVFGPAASLSPGVINNETRAPHLPAGVQGSGPLVTFARSGIAVRWDARFNNLLELAEACSVPVRWSCRTGVCHNCETGLIDGRLAYSPQPLDPPGEGSALICCAAPASNVELDL